MINNTKYMSMKKNLLSFVVILMSLISCDPFGYFLKIENKSNHKIYIMTSSVENDTTWFSGMSKCIGDSGCIAFPAGVLKIDGVGNYELAARNFPSQITCFWFIDENFLIQYRDKKIADTSLIKQKIYTNKELKQMNWVVTYP